ncbi:MAG TPA: hypothetical protein VF188_00660 [Longimicrobiales bacterium]
MSRSPETPPALDSFWEDADHEASDEHPLERELRDRLDALARYRLLIEDARENGRDAILEQLLRQHAREERLTRRIRRAIRRMHGRPQA